MSRQRCKTCGLLWLKNEASRAAAKAPCIGLILVWVEK